MAAERQRLAAQLASSDGGRKDEERVNEGQKKQLVAAPPELVTLVCFTQPRILGLWLWVRAR